MGQTTMTGGQLEKYVNEGDNGDKILRAFITFFNCDEKCNQGNITAIIPPHDVSEEGELSEVDAAQLVEEIKVVFKDTNVARVHKDTESTKDPKVKVFRNMRRTFVSRDFFPGTMITLSILINVFLQIFFPFYKNEEWFVFHVDMKRLPIIEALFCKTSALSFEDRSRLGKSIMGCLLKAMKDCGFTVKQYGDCRFTVTVTELEFKDSASVLMSFIENFTSKLDDNAKKLKKGDKVSVFPSLP